MSWGGLCLAETLRKSSMVRPVQNNGLSSPGRARNGSTGDKSGLVKRQGALARPPKCRSAPRSISIGTRNTALSGDVGDPGPSATVAQTVHPSAGHPVITAARS